MAVGALQQKGRAAALTLHQQGHPGARPWAQPLSTLVPISTATQAG